MKKFFRNYKKQIIAVSVCFSGMVICNLCFGAEDRLSGILMPEIEANFGPDSAIAKGLYVAEFLGCCALWKKTKEASVFVGLPIVMGATYVAFNLIGS